MSAVSAIVVGPEAHTVRIYPNPRGFLPGLDLVSPFSVLVVVAVFGTLELVATGAVKTVLLILIQTKGALTAPTYPVLNNRDILLYLV